MVTILKNKIILSAIIIFSLAIVMQAVYGYYYPGMKSCNDSNNRNYIPGTTAIAQCQYEMDVGQDVTLYAVFYDSGGRNEIPIPSHVELRDPDDDVIYSKDFDSKFVHLFRPSKFGNYTATFTSLEDPQHRLYDGYTLIGFGLGFFPENPESHNYFGRFLTYMWFAGYLLMFGGIGLGIYGVVKTRTKKAAAM